ncbi:GRAM domain-containing protein 2B isoform X3 [Dunckerocampus dactyliophorus]|uniref:GRAM domain-containing protein 2B isoform X3 n=1 Tax=Dunckerocampus dactyliophorus TaxID=161453 RepID=UPI002406F4B5|nr:GRAM domain-containing protein 2B isoform X3 [Dunckerocampus dactyliophorus]
MTEASVGQQEEAWRACRGTSRGDEKDNHVAGSSDGDMAAEERQRCARMLGERLQAAEAEHQEASGSRRAPLVRSKTLDPCVLSQVQSDLVSKLDRKKSHCSQLSKSNCQYHKVFKEISKDEQLRQSYTCALQKDILYQGRMFVSDHWICFHSKVFGKDTKIAIPVTSVTHVKKTKTAILVPNAVVIATAADRYVFVSFLSRDNTYKFLMSVCLHLEEKSPCNSPIPSSTQNNFRTQRSPRTPRFPLGFHANFGALDGALRDRRRDTEESSSSDLQTPDEEKMADFHVPSFLEAFKHGDVSAPPGHHAKKQECVEAKKEERTFSLNTLLCLYLFLMCALVLSSCYLTVKMFSLEQRLATLGSMADLAQHQRDLLQGSSDVNDDFFSELLTINLKKLDKVQKNLQRLLDEAM